MASVGIKVKVAHGANKQEVEFNPLDGFEEFQAILFSLFQVPPERQTIMFRKKKLDKDEDLLSLKQKARLKLIGSAQAAVASKSEVVFSEDMTDADRAQLAEATPPGLQNLGNTCYLNAVVQCLKAIPELNTVLQSFSAHSLNPSVSKTLGSLFQSMAKTEDVVAPYQFVSLFRQAFPRFASVNQKTQGPEQQDAGEFLIELLNALKRDKVENGQVLENMFQGEYEVEQYCAQTEEKEVGTDTFNSLTCFIDKSISHLNFGLLKGMESEMEKRSKKTEQNAIFKKTMRVAKLPSHLIVQLSRFQWKQTDEGGVPCKLLRKIAFPLNLDVTSLCTPALSEKINNYRKKKLDWEDEQREKRQAEGLDLKALKEDKKEADVEMENTETADVNADENTDLEKPETFEDSGEYELTGVVCHKGRSSNSGHYIGYAKTGQGKWMKFDDDLVTEIKKEEIMALYGGGDFQMGYIVFYKKIPTMSFSIGKSEEKRALVMDVE